MKNAVSAALAAATLALAAPAFASPGQDHEKPADTTATDEQQKPRDTQTANADDDLGLKGELNLDDATAQRVQNIVSSAKDQHRTLEQQAKAAMDDLRRAREGNDPQAVKTALDRLRGLHNRMNDLETETVDRIFANLTLQQQADFAIWMADKKHDRLISEDQA
jgi:polyhydroxyalkanoate synthesis regulator phasin